MATFFGIVVSSLTHDITQEGMPILEGKLSSQVHICAMDYRLTSANMSQINTLNRTSVFP